MKKFTFLIFLIGIFVVCLSALTQTNNINNYPLKRGNFFVFKKIEYVTFPYVNNVTFVKCNILKDTIIYGRQYFVFNNFPPAIPINTLWWFRLDSASGRLLRFDSTRNCSNYIFETLWDSLWANLNDSVKICGYFLHKCTDTASRVVFGYNLFHREFSSSFGGGAHLSYNKTSYTEKFGLIYQISGGMGPFGGSYTSFELKGCFISGIVYGDTTLPIGLVKISEEIPSDFNILQNYPNPFNPVTNIKFDIPKSSNVKISIFDILGKEISVLVNEELNPGTFEINWDASNFPSGVYFYMIETGDYSESKKMILIK